MRYVCKKVMPMPKIDEDGFFNLGDEGIVAEGSTWTLNEELTSIFKYILDHETGQSDFERISLTEDQLRRYFRAIE